MSFYRLGSNCHLTFQPSLTYTPRVDGFVIALVVADLNKDGDFDFVVVDKGSNNIDTLLGNMNGIFGEQTTYSTGDDGSPIAVAVDDVNNDAQVDLVVSTYSSPTIDILLSFMNSSFGP